MNIQEINSKLEIKRLKDAKFVSDNEYVLFNGYALFVEGSGFVRFIGKGEQERFKIPYTPCGGKKALQEIIEHGGFVSFEGMEFTGA